VPSAPRLFLLAVCLPFIGVISTPRLFFSESFIEEVFYNRNWETQPQKSGHLTLKTKIASFSFASRHHFPVTIHNLLF